MVKAQPTAQPAYLLLRIPSSMKMTDDQFYEFCRVNHDLRIEQTAKGDIIVMPPTGAETGVRNSELTTTLNIWAKKDGGGITFDSSTGFKLPNGATLSPDAAWVKRSKLATLTPEQKKKFLPLCPDFVIELRSPTDRVADLQDKMQEYIENGVELGWLIEPENREVYVYRPDLEVECLENPMSISGEPELPGFVLELKGIWEPDF